MKPKRLSGVLLYAWGLMILCFASQLHARPVEFPIAVSNSIKMMFPEILTTLDQVATLFDGKYGGYAEDVDLFSALNERFPVEKYKATILTSTELQMAQGIDFSHKYCVRNGRQFSGEFALIGRLCKPAKELKQAKIIHPNEDSFMEFYRNVLVRCLYKDIESDLMPTRIYKSSDLTDATLKDCNLLVLKFISPFEKIVDGSLLYLLQRWGWGPRIPIPFCDCAVSREVCQRFISCLGAAYGFKENIDLDRAIRMLGLRNKKSLKELVGNVWTIQTVAIGEQVKIVAPIQYETRIESLIHVMKKGFLQVKGRAMADPTDEGLRTRLEEYAKGYKLLTDGSEGIIAVANIDYEWGKYRWRLLEELSPIGEITDNLSKREALSEFQFENVKKALDAFEQYFRSREELTEDRIDLNLLYGRVYVIQLRYFLHQHYLNQNDGKRSKKELGDARSMYMTLGREIETVKQKDDYVRLRHMDDFITLDEYFYQKRLEPIARIKL